MDGTMCVLWLPLQPTRKDEGVVWVKGSHLWNKLFLRVLFKDGHKIEGDEDRRGNHQPGQEIGAQDSQ